MVYCRSKSFDGELVSSPSQRAGGQLQPELAVAKTRTTATDTRKERKKKNLTKKGGDATAILQLLSGD
jgi:hypothetical protein